VWFRVFGLADKAPELSALLEHLHSVGLSVVGNFRGDDLGWTGGELVLGDQSVAVERYLTKEDDLRDDLNTWAGWLETRTDQPRYEELMQHVIATKQLVTLKPADAVLKPLCEHTCHWLAQHTDGVYQIDGQGFHAADGTLLLPDDEAGDEP
jgi:hypothetical protein